MRTDTHRSTFPRVRFVHMLAPVALSVGLVVGGYSMLIELADDIASTVRPVGSGPMAPTSDAAAAPVAAIAIAAN